RKKSAPPTTTTAATPAMTIPFLLRMGGGTRSIASSATTGCDFDIATEARTVAAACDSGEPGMVAPVGTRGWGIGDCHIAIVFGAGVGVAAGPIRCDVERFIAPGGDGVEAPVIGPTLEGFARPGGINVDARV